MTITEKKPLFIQIPGEIIPNELPVSASAVGYDFVQGNYLIYATGSDSWVTAPPNTAGIQEYWQSDAPDHIFATGSIAVTGSITGSNLILTAPASRILAPNGALVISSSAGTFITGSLIVSGTRSDIGTETTSVLFNGDIFVSGGIGVNDYIQMKPVGVLRIPTNTTASYIYTSGSTNDMYFTQYQPGTGYTNTTRLRWLESTLSTGLLHGGVLSTTNGSTTFNITSGSGLVLNFNASTTTDPYPTIKKVEWLASTNVPLTYVTSSQITYIGINDSGGIIQRTTPFNQIDYETNIPIGRVLHQTGSVTNGTITSPHTSYGLPSSHDIFVRAFGPLKLSGHVLAASGSTLGLTKTGGDSYVEGRNYTSNPSSPDLVLSTTDFALTASKIYKEYVSGSTPVIDTGVGAAGYTVIDPTKYVDANGTLQTVSGGRFSVQRVYWFPNSVNRALFVYYGTATYNSIDVAQASIADVGFTEGANTAGAAIFVAYIIVRGNASDLSNAAQAKIIQAPLFRAAGVGGGAAGGGTTTPGGLDTYVQFNDGGSTFGGVSTLTFNKTTNTLSTTNLVVSSIATVSGNVILGDAASDIVYVSGSVTASNGLLVNGNLNVNGGVITYGGTTVDGGTIVGQQFEDTDTSGNSYGLVIKNSGTGNGVPFLSFVQGATLASGFAGGIGGWTKAPSSGYIPGLNLSFYSSYPRIGIRNAAASANIATFDANGLQVTGSVNVSNGVKVAAGGLQVAGIVPGISAPYNDTPVIIDLASGQQYGPVIRSVAGQYNFAALSLDQNGTYLGGIYGLENDPGGFGYVDGVNLYVNGANRKINFNVNSVSVGRFTSNGLQVTGSINGSSTITAATGFSGSLTTLTNGSPYLISGPGVTITTGSIGQIFISGSSAGITGKQHITGKEIIGSVSPLMVGQFSWVPSDYTGLTSVSVRAIIATDGAANLTGSLQIYNLTSGSYVDLIDTPTPSKYFDITSSAPTFITSSNLLNGNTNFNNTTESIYEVRVSGSTTDNVIVGSVELVFR